MMRSRKKNAILLALTALIIGGCAYDRVPRIDPSGERVFLPGSAASSRPEPGPARSHPTCTVRVTPASIMAPVGTEVVVVAAVCGDDRFMRTNERVEWAIAPGGVGHFLNVGYNGVSDWLAGEFSRGMVNATYAVGTTMRAQLKLTRGTAAPGDDVCVRAGEGWVTLTSPIEGTSYVTAYVPSVTSWDARNRTAVIHWVKNCQPGLAGTTIVGPSVATSPAITTGPSITTGPAVSTPGSILPRGTPVVPDVGTTRPSATAPSAASPSPSTGGARTAPVKYGIRKTGPSSAAVGATVVYQISIANQGETPVEKVVATDELPAQLTLISTNPPAQQTGRKLQWNVGTLAVRETRRLEVTARADQKGVATSCVEVSGGGLTARQCVNTTIAGVAVEVTMSGPREVALGADAVFEMTITNRSNVAAPPLVVTDTFEAGLVNAVSPSPIERDLKDLAAGQSRKIKVTFRAAKAGKQCHTVTVSEGGAEIARTTGCVNVVAPAGASMSSTPPSTFGTPGGSAGAPGFGTRPGGDSGPAMPGPALNSPGTPAGGTGGTIAPPPDRTTTNAAVTLTVKKNGPKSKRVGEIAEFTILVTNAGTQKATGLKIIDRYDPALKPVRATKGLDTEGFDLVWNLDELLPGKTIEYAINCECVEPVTKACNRIIVTCREGQKGEAEACLEVTPAGSAATPPAGNRTPEKDKPAPPASVRASGLSMTVADSRDPVMVGKELTYEIQVTNKGAEPEEQVRLVVYLPSQLDPVALGTTGPTSPAQEAGRVRFDPIGEMPAGKTVTYRVRTQAAKPGTVKVKAELTSRLLSKPLAIEESTEIFGIPQT